MTAMLLDRERRFADVDLMDHPRRDVEGGLQVMAARGAGIEAMVDESAVDRLGRGNRSHPESGCILNRPS